MAIQLAEMAGQRRPCHHYQLSGQRDLQTIFVALLDLFPCHCNSEFITVIVGDLVTVGR